MRQRFLFQCVIGLCLSLGIQAAPIQWASKVMSFSSEYTDPLLLGREFRAEQILGKPNRYPQFGNSGTAWQTLLPDNPQEEYIIVQFDSLSTLRQVAIFENAGAGVIAKVEALDFNNQLFLLERFIPGYAKSNAQITRILLAQNTPYKVKGLKITLNTSWVRGFSQIDAVGISDQMEPLEESIKLPDQKDLSLIKENIGKNVNSPYIELCPVVSPNGKRLYFTRWKHPDNIGKDKNQDIWFSDLQEDNTWGKAQLFPEPINNDDNNALCSISPNGKTIVLNNVYGRDGRMEKGVSMSFLLRTGEWSFPNKVKIQNFSNAAKFSEYALAPNGKIMLMTTEMKGTQGGTDIFVSFALPDGQWSEPKNLGPVVNTADSESTPFIAPDGVTLYFSSSGHGGYGSNDIFMSRRLDDTWTQWSSPINLGPVINTLQWDGYFSVSAKGDYAYFSSVENSLGMEDIFRIKLPEKIKPVTLVQINGQVLKADGKTAIPAILEVKSLVNSDTLSIEYDPYNGDFSFMWPAKNPFQITAKRKGFMSRTDRFDFSAEKNFRAINRNILLTELQLNKQYPLNNIVFEQSKSDLMAGAYPEMDKLVELLKENTGFKVLLEGHTDNLGDWNENLKLSKERVDNVKNYLILKGIAPERIQTKGWGGSRPLSSNLTEDRRKVNRRVEFTLYID